ncbi:peroxide stress protein YaaA [Algoriphagus boritolerans]|uniref:YaaA family protein n=1 Tax=Algoriphagus boritolerans TaxID=308111 RepID=UPI000AC7AA11
MLILISPAKTLDYSTPNFKEFTHPDFSSDIKTLVSVMKKKSAKEISELMHVSDNLAALNEERYKTFQREFNTENSKQALLAFKGDVYTKIDVDTYSKEDFEFAQGHLRIISGLYGLLKPLDLIQPYRLEMGTRLETKKREKPL